MANDVDPGPSLIVEQLAATVARLAVRVARLEARNGSLSEETLADLPADEVLAATGGDVASPQAAQARLMTEEAPLR